MNHTELPNNKQQRSLYIKAGVVALLILAMMIPMGMINSIVRERAERQQEAVDEVSAKWGGSQTVVGPMISIPYTVTKGAVTERRYIHVLPDKLSVNGELLPEKRSRNLFDVVVYNSKVNFTGTFTNLLADVPLVPHENILFDEAILSVGLSDLRGLEDPVVLKWNNESKPFNAGVETNDAIKTGISTRINLQNANAYTFSFDLALKGSQTFYISPVGKQTDVAFRSTWAHPSFEGAFLPDDRRVDKNGFSARWKLQDLNRPFPQRWTGVNHNLSQASFGVNLLMPVDGYMQTHRAIKYAILFVGLTFLIFLFLELKLNMMIHPLQYVLIGLALCLFYLLLLSMSEHVGYNIAYGIAAAMTIGLIGFYADGVLKQRKFSALVTATLTVLYGFIFTVIQLQDYSLLMGSLGLFFTLAAAMYFSRNVHWYKAGEPELDAVPKT